MSSIMLSVIWTYNLTNIGHNDIYSIAKSNTRIE